MTATRGGRAAGTLALLGAASIWGVTFTLTKPALHHFGPLQVAFLRTVFALPVLAYLHRRSGESLPSLRAAMPFAATGIVGYFLFTNYGLERTSAVAGAVLQGAGPALTALLAVALLGERPDAAVAASVALAGAGVAVLAAGGSSVGSTPVGIVLLFCATLSWALYTVLGRRGSQTHSAIQRSFLPGVLAAVALAVPAGLEGRPHAPPSAWLLLAFLGAVGGGLAYPLWNVGVARITASAAGVLSNASPVVAVVVAWAALGEPVGGRQALGGALVIAGALLVSRGRAEPTFEPQ